MRVALDERGRMSTVGTEQPGAARVRVARSADYAGFWRWLDHALQLDEPPHPPVAPAGAPKNVNLGWPRGEAGAALQAGAGPRR